MVSDDPAGGEESCSSIRVCVCGPVPLPELRFPLALSLLLPHPAFETCMVTEAVEEGLLTHFQGGSPSRS